MGVRLLCGTHLSGRADHVNALVRANWGRVVLLAPTGRYAARRLEQILDGGGLPGAWDKPVLTFKDFATRLLRRNGRHPVLVTDMERRLLFENALNEVRRQPAFTNLGAAADTPGFATHALHIITQLKQAAIEPDAFREKLKGSFRTFLDDVVAELYAVYQRNLMASGLYDLPGLFWEADLLCREEQPRALDGKSTLILDGFDDFTPSEFRLLTSLNARVDQLIFGLPYDPNPDRQDVFYVPAKTARAIQAAFNPAVAFFEERPPSSYSEYAAANVFWRNNPSVPDGLDVNVEVLPCADFTQELETIGRRVKELLRQGHAQVDDIAIVFRNIDEVAGPLRMIMAEMGVPVRIGRDPSLWESAVSSFLLQFLAAANSWQREDIVNILTSPWFRPRDFEHCASYPILSRVAQIIAGELEWRRRLQSLTARLQKGCDEEFDAVLARLPHALEAVDELTAGVDAVAHIAAGIRPEDTPARFAAALLRIIDDAHIAAAIEAYPDEDIRRVEREALQALRGLLAQWRLWDDAKSIAMARADLVALFRQSLSETTFRVPREPAGVACIDAERARHLAFDYVFLVGVNDGAVPRPPANSAIYSEEDIDRLVAAGIAIEGKRVHSRREMLLFHHMLNVPRKKMWVTWHRTSRQGKEEYPSPYVDDLLELFPGKALQAPMPAANAFVPNMEDAASWRDIANALALAGAMPKSCPPQLEWTSAGIDVESRRDAVGIFDCFDGALSDSAMVGHIAGLFGKSHLFSVDQLEAYAACPFHFLIERVLRVEEAGIPVAEFDSMVRGTIMHEVLQRFHEEYKGVPAGEIDFDEGAESLRRILQEVFHDTSWRSSTAPAGVEAVEQRRLDVILCRYLRIEQDRAENQWRPWHFEVGFGRNRGKLKDPISTNDPFALDVPPDPVLFSGRIDRIDIDDEGQARIIDYKSSAAVQAGDIDRGLSLQLTIYALALQEMLLKIPCAEAWFVTVGRKNRVHGLGRKKEVRTERERTARECVASSVAGIRAGYFPPKPSDKACAYCTAARACRYDASRIERKTDR